MDDCTPDLNPGCSMVTVYVPNTRSGDVYSPESLVVRGVSTPVLLSTMRTVALATGVPLGSVTRPVIVARSARCPQTAADRSKAKQRRRRGPKAIPPVFRLVVCSI